MTRRALRRQVFRCLRLGVGIVAEGVWLTFLCGLLLLLVCIALLDSALGDR